MRALLAAVVVLSGCAVEESDDVELSETSSELGVGWCNDAEVPVLNLPLENGKPINIEEPFIRVANGLVFLYFSDRVIDERDLHYAIWTTSGFVYLGRVQGVNSATGIEGAPSIDPHGNFYFTSSGTPGQIAHGTLSSWGTVTYVGPVYGMPQANVSGNVLYGNMDIGVAPSETFAVLSRAAWLLPAGGLPAAADLWYLRRLSPTTMLHYPTDTANFLGALNTPDKLEYAPEISTDGLQIFYTQTTLAPVTTAILTASRPSVTMPFGPPTTIVGPTSDAIIEGPTVTPGNDRIFYHRAYGEAAPSKLYTVARCAR